MSGSFTELSPLDVEPTPFAMTRGVYEDIIRERAYEIYLARRAAGIEGTPEQDWEMAAAELGDPIETVGSTIING